MLVFFADAVWGVVVVDFLFCIVVVVVMMVMIVKFKNMW